MITASLVLYKTPTEVFAFAITSFLDGIAEGDLVVIDNSPEPITHALFSHRRVRYVFSGENLGFGAAHNKALDMLSFRSGFHLLLNPDVRFGPDVLPHLKDLLENDDTIGAVMPRIVFPDGSLQRLCKLLPTPADLFLRRFIPFPFVRERVNRRYELFTLPQDRVCDVPSLSGCFLLMRTALVRKLGGFDERYFMYMEDVDLVRRVGDFSRTVYDPSVTVVHEYGKGSYRSRRLLRYHLRSAISYFFRWGWLYDAKRASRNKAVLRQVREL